LTKARSPRFGLGAEASATAFETSTMPTPSESGAAAGVRLAVSMRAPLTWSGPHVRCAARIWAAPPATMGAAKDVPESWMYPGATILSGRSRASVEAAGAGPTM
jgi:hypothetical protein